MAKQTAEIVRGRGRPETFPGVELVSIMTRVPAETQEQFREIAKRANRGKGENLGKTFARLVEQAYAASERGRAQARSRNSG